MATIPDWEYEQPTEKETLKRFADVVGTAGAEAMWEMACHRLGVARPVGSDEELVRVAEELMELGELARVAGRSLKVRAVMHRALARTVPA